MKKLMKLTVAAAVSFVALAANSHAQVITSIQFTQHPYLGSDLAPTDVAGATAVDNWNVVDPIGSNGIFYTGGGAQVVSASSGLITSTGGSSGVGYSLTSGGALTSSPGQANAANNTLLESGGGTYGAGNNASLYGTPVTLTLSGLNASDTYSFDVYVEGSNYNLGEGSVSLSSSGSTQYFTSTLGGFAATPVTTLVDKATSTDFSSADVNNPGGAASAYNSNYVVFSGITGVTSDTLSLTSLGSWPSGSFITTATPNVYGNSGYGFSLSGVQVIDTAAVPEPSTWAMMLGGLGMLAFCVRRKAASVK